MKKLSTLLFVLLLSCSTQTSKQNDLELALKECHELAEQGKRQDLLIKLNKVEEKYKHTAIWAEYSEKFHILKPMENRFKK